MRVKRFVAKNIQDAMVKVKMEMGKDAIILNTRKFKEGGFLGFFAKEFVEVTAALDENYRLTENRVLPKPEEKNQVLPEREGVNYEIKEEINKDRDVELNNELTEMKSQIKEIIDKIEYASLNIGLSRAEKKFFQILVENDVEEKLASRIVKRTMERIPSEKQEDKDYIRQEFIETIGNILKKPKPIVLPQKRKQMVFALVGPTGVGKTTTIAKLAANFALNDQKKIALITSDTYRIAAVEQLKTVGEIMGIPVEVVFTPQSMKNSILNHKDKDLIFIDTAGRSHKNVVQMTELKGFLEAAQPDETFLVLSATTRYKDMLEIINNFEKVNFSRLLFTKLDETSTYGAILSTVYKTKKNLSYCTTGQNVPDDIEVADYRKLAELILGDGAQ